MQWPRPRRLPARMGLLVTMLAVPLLATACKDADTLVRLAPQVIAPRAGTSAPPHAVQTELQGAKELPPQLPAEGFEFVPAGVDANGQLVFHIRILQGGHPYQVAMSKLTPLFLMNGKTAAT